jgi:hypothetical protein
MKIGGICKKIKKNQKAQKSSPHLGKIQSNQTRKIGQPVKQKTNEIKSPMNPC